MVVIRLIRTLNGQRTIRLYGRVGSPPTPPRKPSHCTDSDAASRIKRTALLVILGRDGVKNGSQRKPHTPCVNLIGNRSPASVYSGHWTTPCPSQHWPPFNLKYSQLPLCVHPVSTTARFEFLVTQRYKRRRFELMCSLGMEGISSTFRSHSTEGRARRDFLELGRPTLDWDMRPQSAGPTRERCTTTCSGIRRNSWWTTWPV